MHEYHSSDKADALAVSCVAVCHGVGMEHPPQGGLTALLLGAGKVRMGGKGTTCMWVYALEQTILFLTKKVVIIQLYVPVVFCFDSIISLSDETQDHMH